MKLKSKIIAGVFGAVALAAVPVSIALTATSCGSGDGSSNGSTNDSSNGSGSGQGGQNNGGQNGNGPQVGSGGADIVGLKKPIPGVITNDLWKKGDTFIQNGFTYQLIDNPNYFVPDYGFPVAQPKMSFKIIAADPGVVNLNQMATNNATGVVDYYDNLGRGHIALPVTSIGANLLPNAVIGAPTTPQEIVIPDSVSEIGENAFTGLVNDVSRIVLGNSLRVIGASAFSNLKCIAGLAFPQVTTTIGQYAFENTLFSGELVIPPKVKTISDSAFSSCAGFTGVKFPNGLQIIGNSAFDGCLGLTGRLYIPESVTNIGNNAFWNNTAYETQSVYVSQNCMNSINESTQTKNLIFKPISQRPSGEEPPANAFTAPFVEPGENIQPQEPIPGLILNSNWNIGDQFETRGWTYEIIKNPSYKIPPFGELMDQPQIGLKIVKANMGVVDVSQMADDNETGILNYSEDRTKGPIALPVVEVADDPFGVGNAQALSSPQLTLGDGSPVNFRLPDTVVKVGYGCFPIRNQVLSFQLSKNLEYVGPYAFYTFNYDGELILPKTLTTLTQNCFSNSWTGRGWTGQLVLPPKIVEVPFTCFAGNRFTSIKLNDGLQRIASLAFCNNQQLGGTLTIPESVVQIQENAFLHTAFPPQTVFVSSICVITNPGNENLVFQKRA